MLTKDKIQFGTDGWRSVIADGFTFDNVKRVAQATCDVLKKTSKSRLILIGYDRRFFSNRFALTAAHVAMANGFRVEMTSRPITSPTLSFHVHERKAAVGIMITASHNPFQFNGFKLKGPHGGSVDENLTQAIEAKVDASPIHIAPAEPKKVDFVPAYLTSLKKRVNLNMLSRLKGPIVFDGMHGPGGELFEELCGKKSNIIFIRKDTDPFFGGGNPEPIEERLNVLRETVLKSKASMGLAVDGDADRIGVVDNTGRYLPPHTVMPLIMLHLLENRKLKGSIIQTVSMGYLPAKIAKQFGASFEEVSVGFKHIAKKMTDGKVLFGGEESGGYGVGIWSPERDGLLCALLLVEMVAMRKTTLSSVVDDLYKRFGGSHFKRIDFSLREPVVKSTWTNNILSQITQQFVGRNVKNVNSLDGIKIVLEDDSWVLMRPSGTEPLIRTYAEGTSDQVVRDLLAEADRLVHLPTQKEKNDLKILQKRKRSAEKARAKKK